ncbi:MAG: hypothetical protein J6W00_08830 [Lentisphaeria bacterium]|nr:hypothetical protein [Lentisphaeria bacterium]
MITMLEVFFKDIPSIVFEPIAICGWLGLFIAFILYRKKCSVFYLTVIFSLAFMILWRVAIQIVSSRYAEILISPMTIAAAFFIFQLENIRKIMPQFPEKYVKYLPLGILIILIVICIGKNLSYNTYTSLMDVCGMVKADKTPGKRVLYVMNSDRVRQIEYYSGEKVRWLTAFTKAHPQILTPDLCREIIAQAAAENSAEIVYIFAVASGKEPVITAKEIGVKDSSWELFTEKPLDRKSKKLMRVYRCDL